ncbi:MAG: LD-carboxypeptidase [Clostridiales bacterium]|nr:LD-carboxypeptidase [Clostridiales bacterium]
MEAFYTSPISGNRAAAGRGRVRPYKIISTDLLHNHTKIFKEGFAIKLPNFLKQGDKVALISVSSPQPQGTLEAAMQSVADFGLNPVAYATCGYARGYLAGTDAERARDLIEAFDDDDIAGVICIRGGYGAHRVFDLVNFDRIAASGKPLYGYSDVTALHIAMQNRGVISFQTPMPGTEWYKGLDDYTKQGVRQLLFGPLPSEIANPDGAKLNTMRPGIARGELVGGNLSLVTSTIGTPYQLDVDGKILFLEDVGESPRHLDRMLLQLRHSGLLTACAGIIFGAFTDCAAENPDKSLTIEQVLDDLTADLNIPVVSDLQCGHCMPTASLPLGAQIILDARAGKLVIAQ